MKGRTLSMFNHTAAAYRLKELCAPGETVLAFFKRRDAMMKAAAEILAEAGFHRKGLWGTYTRQ